MRSQTRGYLVAAMLATLLACDSNAREKASGTAGASASGRPTTTPVSPGRLNSPPPKPEEKKPPSGQELATAALEAGNYEPACAYLVGTGFGKPICDWLLATIASGRDKGLSSETFERFLRTQHVRKLSGRIVGFYDEARNEYEVRIGGRLAILVATETAFSTTGGFSMWAQELEKSEEELGSGRTVRVQVYREWPLFRAIYDTAVVRGPKAKDVAIDLLKELVRGWEDRYCYKSDPLSMDCDRGGGTQPTARADDTTH